MKNLLISTLALLMCISFIGCTTTEPLEPSQTDPVTETQETPMDYGYVEKETVDTLIAKFNTQIVDNSSLNPAMDEYMSINNDQYWYGLITGIYCVAVPEEYTGDKTKDTVDRMFLYVPSDCEYQSDVMTYFDLLIKANNSELTDTESEQLISEAEALAESATAANNGTGIFVGIYHSEEHSEYQVNRNHK